MSKSVNETGAESVEPKTELVEEFGGMDIMRTATALTRYPVHRLTKHGEIDIEFRVTDEDGQVTVVWEASHNSKYGQPGPLAYKLDTLIVNRRIEEAGYPLPDQIKLGSIRDMCRELGLDDDGGKQVAAVRRALFQNASAMIVAQVRYTGRDKSKNVFEFGTARYSVILAGQMLPDGRKADAVYIVLNPVYRELLDRSQLRPLDYAYLKSLKQPVAQRFYELVSFQIYGALQSARGRRAKYLYSEFCQQAPQQRYFEPRRMRMQMKEVHAPHLASGYIEAPVEFRETTDSEGRIDWEMLYTPGPRARTEFREVNNRLRAQAEQPKPRGRQREPLQFDLPLQFELPPSQAPGAAPRPSAAPATPLAASASASVPSAPVVDPATSELVELLVAADLNRGDAERFALARPEVCRKQLEFLPFVGEFKSSRGAYLRRAIEGDFAAPSAHARQQHLQQAREEAIVASERQQTRGQAQRSREEALQSHEKALCGAYERYLVERVGEASKTQPEASTSLLLQEAAQRSTYTNGPLAGRPLTEKALEVFDREESRLERARLFWRAHGVEVLSFWQWDEQLNPEPFQPHEPPKPQ